MRVIGPQEADKTAELGMSDETKYPEERGLAHPLLKRRALVK
jgi:hypothetical protein